MRATEGGKAIQEKDSESDPQSASTYSRTWKYQKDFRHSLLPFAIYLFVKTDEQNLLSGQLSTNEVTRGRNGLEVELCQKFIGEYIIRTD